MKGFFCLYKHIKNSSYYETTDHSTFYTKFTGTSNIKKYYVFYNNTMIFNPYFFHKIYKKFSVYTFSNKKCMKLSESSLRLQSYVSMCNIIKVEPIISYSLSKDLSNIQIVINKYHIELIQKFKFVNRTISL